ncbi:hypothetical protein EDD17DRAFT_418170 [Pisolithus thermaeus]|nr:hypothetical protein EDD17DRAFT_418170 [Pisolithus thermaeus]
MKGATREAGYDRSSPRQHACRHNIPCHPTRPGRPKLSILFAILSALILLCGMSIAISKFQCTLCFFLFPVRQVMILLLVANALADFLWLKDLDPDMCALLVRSATTLLNL